MDKPRGRLRNVLEKFSKCSVAQIGEAFSSWVQLPENFGGLKRRRLFFPLYGLLDVSGPGT